MNLRHKAWRTRRAFRRGVRRQGSLDARRKKFGIVVSRFNEFITKRLLESAIETLVQHGAAAKGIETIWVPGALEAPFFVKQLARGERFDALIVLGCILRGDTIHFECVSNETIRGISQVALETGVPIASGIITAENLEQAIDRAGLKAGNKGAQAALAAIEIANLNKTLA
jgi:6,7-dimethyl-8-ribityllumazine synthase